MNLEGTNTTTLKKLSSIPDFEKSSSQILDVFRQSSKLLITTHTNPDGDAIGSCLALYNYLLQHNKQVSIVIHSPIPSNLRFLIGIDKFQENNDGLVEQISSVVDTIVVLDLNDISRLKSLRKAIESSNATKIVIDHHLEPKDFANYYLIDTTASSTGEILYKLLRKDPKTKWSKELCDSLYVAIMTDTGNFRFERTDGEVHRIVADLIDFGVDPVHLYNEVYNKLPLKSARLMGLGFSNLESFYNGKLAVMPIRQSDFIKTNTKEEDTEGFVESILTIDGVIVSILILEVPERNEVRVSIRSKGDFSARNLALAFGGGGHKNAAGCRFYNEDFEIAKMKLVEEAKNIV